MDEIRIPNHATYFPVALTDVMLAAPLVSRLVLGAWLPGRVLQAAALGVYSASALADWIERLGVRRIDFRAEFGADVRHLVEMPPALRAEEIRVLARRVDDGYVPLRRSRQELAVVVDRQLTGYIASITGQWVETSVELRGQMLAQLVFPFALGATDMLSGDVALFRSTGIFEPHVIAHEFCHRKGYYKELEAQALSYLSLCASGDPELVQAALCERLHRNLRVLAGRDPRAFRERVERLGLRPELEEQFLALQPPREAVERGIAAAMRALYEERMRLTGQNGLSDYDRGFTDFLYTFEARAGARQSPPPAGAIHNRPI